MAEGVSGAAYSDVFDALPTGIVETDPGQRILRCNRAFAAMVGVRVEEIVGEFGWVFFHPDSPPPNPSAVDDLRAGRRSTYSVERLLRGPDGSGLPVQMDWAVIRGEAGRVEVLVCAVTDVSNHARTTADLERAQERAEVLWQRAPVGLIDSTPDGVITSVNPSLSVMVGRDPDELVGTPISTLGEPDQAVATEAALQRLARSGEATSAERSYVHADGSSIPVYVSAAVLHDDAGAVDRVTSFVVDVTEAHAQRAALAEALDEIRLARDELARRQHFTDALLEKIDVGIVACDADGSNLFRNRAERLLVDGPGSSGRSAPPAAAEIDILDPAGVRLDPEHYPLARTLRGESVTDTDFRMGPRGGPHRDVVIRASRITAPDSTVLGAVVAITDVTAERTVRRELAAEQERLSQAQRLGQIGSFSYDVHGGTFHFSREIFRIWGLPPDADLAALRRQMIHPDDRPRVVEHWQSASRIAGEHSIGYRIVRPDGAVRHLQVSLEVDLDPAGEPVTLRGTHLDVTDLTVARLEAIEANALFTAILTATPDYTFVTNVITGAVVYGSPGQSILGLTADQLTAFGPRLIASLVHPDDQARLRATHLAARDLADGEVLHLRYQARHADRSWRWLDRRVTPFHRDPATGQVQEVLGVMRDVTDEHENELALRDQGARMRALITQVVDYAIIGLDPAGVIETWNDGAQRLKGYDAEHAVGRHFSMFYSEDDRAADLPNRLLDEARTQGRSQSTGWRVRADGTQFWAHVVITALHDEEGVHTGFVKVTRDLTAQHQLERAQNSLFATVTHDLRTPITVIKAYASLMAKADPAVQTEYLVRIDANADRLGRLVDDLFNYAKVRAGVVPISLEPISLPELSRACADNLGPALGDHPVEVHPAACLAMADRAAMQGILANLLTNAAKYSPDGSPITIAFESNADRVRLSVTDRGRGIAPEDVDTIFSEFVRGRLADDADGGTGLGLASVRRMATQQGGRTWIESELGRGTTVTVELARAPETSTLPGMAEQQ